LTRAIAAALGKPLIILHQDEHAHALKEVDAAALAVAKTPDQVVSILAMSSTGSCPATPVSRTPRSKPPIAMADSRNS
jgi:hypothetical protein